ncbi:MAG TPA: ABC transporter permease, partial [Vicinamibacteria bacterium]|nr:ABC transporter permease [Vicinamibacteria bacterium]
LATLILGVGANTAIFSLVKAVVLNPLPYEAPEEIVVLWERKPEGGTDFVSPPNFQDWREGATSFEAIAAFRHVRYGFKAEEPRDLPSLRATPDLFEVLGVEAQIGRTFTSDEAVPGHDKVVLLSAGMWRRDFGGKNDVVGRTIELDSVEHTVVGVMGDDFVFPPGNEIQLWTPLAFDPNDAHGRSRRARALSVVGRLRGGVGLAQAREEMSTIASRLAAEYPDTNQGWGVVVESAHEQLVSAARPALLVLLGAVGFLLLILCANIANLMLARLTTRRREIALLAALGAGRFALFRQVLSESLLLTAVGAGLGTLAAVLSMRVVRNLPVTTIPRLSEVKLDFGVLLFTACVSILVALAFGLLPALRASRPELRESLGENARGGTQRSRRILGLLVAAEVALALVLLVGAGLTLRSFREMMRVDPGFRPERLLAAQVYLPQARYRDTESRLSFFARTLERVRGLPGVESAAAVSSLPMHPVGIDFALPFTIEGRNPVPGEEPRADIRAATEDYFETMKIPLLSGRLIDERDHQDAPHVVVINETLARRYFAGEDPMRKIIDNPHGKSEVVGVVADVHHYGLDAEPRPELYLPFDQNVFSGMSIVLRTGRPPEEIARDLRETIWQIDGDQAIYDMSTMEEAIDRWVFLPRLSTTLLAAFAGAALLLASVGIYGVIAYSVSQRTTEMGLRMALGAGATDLIGLVVRNSMTFVGAGMFVGLVASLLLARLLSGQLFAVSSLDPFVYFGVSLLLLLAALAASYVPARRATRVDPIEALRVE